MTARAKKRSSEPLSRSAAGRLAIKRASTVPITEHLAAFHGQVQPLEPDGAAVVLGQTLGFDDRCGCQTQSLPMRVGQVRA